MNAFVTYLKHVRAELTHVVWPPRMQAVYHTIIIIVISAVLALAIAGLDYLFTQVVARLVG
jgi:preprotein translocase subunit SecE